jgi:hypothetical protein
MALTANEKADLREYVLERACSEYRSGKPCVQRDPRSEMIGERHAGCVKAEEMLALVEKA